MPEVFRIGYVDLFTPDLPSALDYYRSVIGATATARDSGSAYLSLGLDHHNIALHLGEAPGLRALGLQLCRDRLVADIARRLAELGLRAEVRSDTRPGVAKLVQTEVGGHCFELFEEQSAPAPGFASAGVVPNRIGHVALLTPEADELVGFLADALGFWTTDRFEDLVTFLTCNRDHHVMNVIQAPIAAVHHVAFELRGWHHQVEALDKLRQVRRGSVWGPSRHTAGHNLASYHYGADGLLVEFFSDMDVYLSDTGTFEPRPWHEDLPQRPKRWSFEQMTAWETSFEFDFRTVAFGAPAPGS